LPDFSYPWVLIMRRFRCAFLGTVAVIGFVLTASAADMPVKAPVDKAPVATNYNWTGWYVGGNVGYGWGGSTGNDLTATDPIPIFPGYAALGGFQYPSVSPRGAIGGGQIGYNFQTGNVVWGAVADFQFSGMTASNTVAVPQLLAFLPENQSHSAKIEWFGTVRGRIGYAFNNFLPYISGGLAYGKVSSTLNLFIPASAFIMSGQSDSTRAGWTLGGGFEYGLNNNWSVGVDYLYMDLGHTTVSATPQTSVALVAGTVIAMNQHSTANILRAVLNYKF
jgi:outer membrane immunogenic protein